MAQFLQHRGFSPGESYRVVLSGYIATGCLLAGLFLFLSPAVETVSTSVIKRSLGLHRSQRVVASLSLLFALDAFAGGFVVQSLMAYWFHQRFGVDEAVLGRIFFGANILAGMSALLAARLSERIGLIRTMVFTHLPSNVLLCLIPLMPTLSWAVGVLLVRFSISQMDVPTRQAYTMAVVAPDERAAASGITSIARSIGASLSPALSGLFLTSTVWFSAPFFVAGGLKIVYDLLLYRRFQAVNAGEEEPIA